MNGLVAPPLKYNSALSAITSNKSCPKYSASVTGHGRLTRQNVNTAAAPSVSVMPSTQASYSSDCSQPKAYRIATTSPMTTSRRTSARRCRLVLAELSTGMAAAGSGRAAIIEAPASAVLRWIVAGGSVDDHRRFRHAPAHQLLLQIVDKTEHHRHHEQTQCGRHDQARNHHRAHRRLKVGVRRQSHRHRQHAGDHR